MLIQKHASLVCKNERVVQKTRIAEDGVLVLLAKEFKLIEQLDMMP